MLNQELIDELRAAQALPASAIARAVAAPEQIADAVLSVLEKAGQGENLAESEANLLFWGIHVLGAVRDQRAFQPLMRLLRQPPDRLETLLGDAETITLPKIVASVFDGDAAALHKALADTLLEDTSRMGLFGRSPFSLRPGESSAVTRVASSSASMRSALPKPGIAPGSAGKKQWCVWA